jgi:hypothetical protein
MPFKGVGFVKPNSLACLCVLLLATGPFQVRAEEDFIVESVKDEDSKSNYGICDGYSQSDCQVCFTWGEDTFLKVGGGLRASYNSLEGGNPANGGTRQDFNVNNARIYLNGQGHERIGFEFNTDINNAQGFDVNGGGFGGNAFGSLDEGGMRILDAIVKFQLTDNIHLWFGRMLPPSDRSNLSGPFYLNAWNFPFVQFGYPNIFQGRDDGAALWGEHGGGAFKWQIGAYEGESFGGPVVAGHPASDNLLMAGRVVLNLLDPEPGYYNSSTYYGEKDILAIGAAAMHRHDALANFGAAGEADYTGWNLDFLFEKKLCNGATATLEAAYYDFTDNNGVGPGGGAVTLPPHGFARQGESYFILGSYLFASEQCLFGYTGKYQLMARYQQYDHDAVAASPSGTTDQVDIQINYIAFGHNARLSAVWTQLDPAGPATDVDIFTLGAQLQF